MHQEFEITEHYQIGPRSYVDKLRAEIDEDGLILHPLQIFILSESEPKLLGEEETTTTLLKPSAIALAKHILSFYGEDVSS